jgi:hypothetical protein
MKSTSLVRVRSSYSAFPDASALRYKSTPDLIAPDLIAPDLIALLATDVQSHRPGVLPERFSWKLLCQDVGHLVSSWNMYHL